MGQTFYFYDLETTGFNPRTSRIMQFAGQRTDEFLKPLGKPDNYYLKLTPDVLPDPDAVMVTGITPQKTLAEGVSEAEFLEYFDKSINKPGTIFTGFNNIRFDDEFMRFTFWRNFYDSYEWQWKAERSRWDLLDAVRMTRALRPDGIKWPYGPDGKPSNRLELLASVNGINHSSAHDALSDVNAAIGVATLLCSKQPKIFNYLLKLRDKKKVAALVEQGEPLVYSSGRYPSEYEKTTVAVAIAPHPNKSASLMYDLRVDPSPFFKLDPPELVKMWQSWGDEAEYFPVKVCSYNRCPAIAPLSVLDKEAYERIKISKSAANSNLRKLVGAKDFAENLVRAIEIMQPKKQSSISIDIQEVDELLYDGFVSNDDRLKQGHVRKAKPSEINDLEINFADERLKQLLPLYKARNFPEALSTKQKKVWNEFIKTRLTSGGSSSRLKKYLSRIEQLKSIKGLTPEKRQLLEELKLYGLSIAP